MSNSAQGLWVCDACMGVTSRAEIATDEQVRTLREFVGRAGFIFRQMGPAKLGEWNWPQLATESEAILAATALKNP